MAFHVRKFCRLLLAKTLNKPLPAAQISNISAISSSSSSLYFSKLFPKNFCASSSLNNFVVTPISSSLTNSPCGTFEITFNEEGSEKIMMKDSVDEHQTVVTEDADGLSARFVMQNLTKEDVKLYVDENVIHIKGEEQDSFYPELQRKYSGKIVLLPGLYRTDKIKAEMDCGVLHIVVPKINRGKKLQEKVGVFQVSVN